MGNGQIDDRAIDVLHKDLEYRRKKQWDIFSWCSTILVSINGGVFALATRKGDSGWPIWERLSLSLAICAVAVFAQSWIHYHWQYELERCETLGRSIGFPIFNKRPPIGYPQILAPLAVTALLAIWGPSHM